MKFDTIITILFPISMTNNYIFKIKIISYIYIYIVCDNIILVHYMAIVFNHGSLLLNHHSHYSQFSLLSEDSTVLLSYLGI